ncbi:GNAT family N-acetyltransferase [Alkalibacillus haloalkaliphilus]|uniref:GNAT family N-acetyltransferase n=1 Tax=Alkalibacillus haloalkaliphilus TaxID=94136 RepID=UPI0002E9F53E|nr:GNAT family N-acetyltransferase [Alkalibacillus haloalkaliphilus]
MFETKRCFINKLQKSNFDDVKKLYVDQKVRKFLGGVCDEDSVNKLMDEMLHSEGDSYNWIVKEKATGHFIGLVSLNPHHDGENLEISYQFLPEWWGQGYASEVVQGVINFAFNDLNLLKVVAETQTANIDSCKLLEKLGMKLEHKVVRFGAEQAIYSIQSSYNN